MDLNQIRSELLKSIKRRSSSTEPLQQVSILSEVSDKFGQTFYSDKGAQEALLTVWYDLFRIGYLAWGFNLSNPNPPFFHLTERSHKFLENFSRDPANSDGYLHYLKSKTSFSPVVESYIREALNTFNNDCYKAAAVMVGCASESLVLELSEVIIQRKQNLQTPLLNNHKINQQKISAKIEGISDILKPHSKNMGFSLEESFNSHWPSFVHYIRITRNEVGHPKNIQPVTDDEVHAGLLMFPIVAELTTKLIEWVNKSTF